MKNGSPIDRLLGDFKQRPRPPQEQGEPAETERETLHCMLTNAHYWAARIFSKLEVIEHRLATMEARYYWEDRGKPGDDAGKGPQE